MKKLGIFLLILFSLNVVFSAGISAPYWPGSPLKMTLGQERIIELKIQNVVGEEDLKFKVEIVSDEANIASLLDNPAEYFVEFGRDDIVVPLKITIPNDLVGEKSKNIDLKFSTIPLETEEGMVVLTQDSSIRIPVEIVSEQDLPLEEIPLEQQNPPQKGNFFSRASLLILLLILIILIAITAVVIFIKKRKSKVSDIFTISPIYEAGENSQNTQNEGR